MYGYPHWRIRRNFMFVVTGFCMLVIAGALLTGQDTRVAETAVTMAFVTILGNVGSYVFGATWEDINRDRAKKDSSP